MRRKCSKCDSISIYIRKTDGKARCKNCGHEWTPNKHAGKKYIIVGDGILTTRRRVMPGAKTKVIGDGILTRKKRVKKVRKKRDPFSFF